MPTEGSERPQEEYHNKVEYYRNQFPQKGAIKGAGKEPGSGGMAEQARRGGKGMEGCSQQNPHVPMFIELPMREHTMSTWKPPSPPKVPLMTEPKASACVKGKREKKEPDQQRRVKGKALKRRTMWVMSTSEESEDEGKQSPIKTVKKSGQAAVDHEKTPSGKQKYHEI